MQLFGQSFIGDGAREQTEVSSPLLGRVQSSVCLQPGNSITVAIVYMSLGSCVCSAVENISCAMSAINTGDGENAGIRFEARDETVLDSSDGVPRVYVNASVQLF